MLSPMCREFGDRFLYWVHHITANSPIFWRRFEGWITSWSTISWLSEVKSPYVVLQTYRVDPSPVLRFSCHWAACRLPLSVRRKPWCPLQTDPVMKPAKSGIVYRFTLKNCGYFSDKTSGFCQGFNGWWFHFPPETMLKSGNLPRRAGGMSWRDGFPLWSTVHPRIVKEEASRVKVGDERLFFFLGLFPSINLVRLFFRRQHQRKRQGCQMKYPTENGWRIDSFQRLNHI